MTFSREDARAALQRIQKNRHALDNCRKHRFEFKGQLTIGQRAFCGNCGGDMLLTEVAQYVRGYAAAGGNPNEIIPGWTEKPDDG